MAKIRLADALVKILEKEGTKFVFGHPGEQILPFYQALQNSSIKHILTRHEQGAAHAADGYARSSFQPGVCVASAGPGALNLVMGVATAYKDSIPLLVITGDVSSQLKGENVFQDVDINAVFEPITLQSHLVKEPQEGIQLLKMTILTLKTGKTGPIHLNIPRDVLQMEVDQSLLDETVELNLPNDWSNLKPAEKLVENSKKPLILAGAGVLWAHAVDDLHVLAEKHRIPVATTYPARGVLSEDHPLSLGLLGQRGTKAANFAGKNSDLVLAMGCRLSERTLKGLGDVPIIQVNLDEKVLKGSVNIQADVKKFLEKIRKTPPKNTDKWLEQLSKHPKTHKIRTNFKKLL
ncbi:thiamine pyrophosphate-binding protein [Methanobacterium petrolearium]|uniref:thiamine pyrophosphate-binding protein n=1 Tax=Methanobacterium petrolearium TaxID=710190 RepID=UPI00308194F3|nr:hypothetical protein GCM10025861_26370 [Methanobacterium petrolearium]